MCVCVYTVATRLTRHARCRGSLPRYRATAGWARYILINILFVCVSSFIRVNPIFIYMCVYLYMSKYVYMCVCVYGRNPTDASRALQGEATSVPRHRGMGEVYL